jgi:hypothetical protein
VTAGWDRHGHRTAQQRHRDRPAKLRKVDKAALAPKVKVQPVVCGRDGCGCPRLAHNPECSRCRECPDYVEPDGPP